MGTSGGLRCLHGKVDTTISCMDTCIVGSTQCSGCVVYDPVAIAAITASNCNRTTMRRYPFALTFCFSSHPVLIWHVISVSTVLSGEQTLFWF